MVSAATLPESVQVRALDCEVSERQRSYFGDGYVSSQHSRPLTAGKLPLARCRPPGCSQRHIQQQECRSQAGNDAFIFLRCHDFSSLSELTKNDDLLFLVPLAKRKYQVKISPVWQVGHVGHSVRAVVTQREKFALKLVRADDHDVRANVELVASPIV